MSSPESVAIVWFWLAEDVPVNRVLPSAIIFMLTFKVISIENTAVKKASKYFRIYKHKAQKGFAFLNFKLQTASK